MAEGRKKTAGAAFLVISDKENDDDYFFSYREAGLD